jgi:hypothetical protein
MRLMPAVLFAILLAAAGDTARADPYRWCSVYSSGEEGGSSNCYFMTLEQCRANVSGIGGFCTPNPFYDGRPIGTPGEAAPRTKRRGQR